MSQSVQFEEWTEARAAAQAADQRAQICRAALLGVTLLGSGLIGALYPTRVGFGSAFWVLGIGVGFALYSRGALRRRFQRPTVRGLKDRLSSALGVELSNRQCADLINDDGAIIGSIKYKPTFPDGTLEFQTLELNTREYRSLPTWWS